MSDRPRWQANYKSMHPAQLVAELARIARHPRLFDDRVERKLYLTTELALRSNRPTRPIILMEVE